MYTYVRIYVNAHSIYTYTRFYIYMHIYCIPTLEKCEVFSCAFYTKFLFYFSVLGKWITNWVPSHNRKRHACLLLKIPRRVAQSRCAASVACGVLPSLGVCCCYLLRPALMLRVCFVCIFGCCKPGTGVILAPAVALQLSAVSDSREALRWVALGGRGRALDAHFCVASFHMSEIFDIIRLALKVQYLLGPGKLVGFVPWATVDVLGISDTLNSFFLICDGSIPVHASNTV